MFAHTTHVLPAQNVCHLKAGKEYKNQKLTWHISWTSKVKTLADCTQKNANESPCYHVQTA